MTETFYDLLGVSEDASTAEIEDAYRAAIKRVHPDVSDDVDAGERTKRLNKAKRVLTDDEERERYDRVGHASYTAGGPTDSTGTTSDTTATSTGPSPKNGSRAADSDGPGTEESAGRRRRSRRDASGTTDSGGSSGGSTHRRSHRKGRRRGTRHDQGSGRATSRSGEPGTRTGDRQYRGGNTRSGSRRVADDAGGSAENPWDVRGRGQSTDRTGPSRPSQGPSWQTSRGSANAAGARKTASASSSAQRQAAAGRTDGAGVDWSWNAWDQTRSWAVRQGSRENSGLHPGVLVPDEQSFLLLTTSFLLYPFFIASIVFPAFPLLARVLVAVCTLLMFAYLLSVPGVAVVVFGLWSVLLPTALFLLPETSVLSVIGVIGLSVTWVPFALSLLTFSVLRT